MFSIKIRLVNTYTYHTHAHTEQSMSVRMAFVVDPDTPLTRNAKYTCAYGNKDKATNTLADKIHMYEKFKGPELI